MGRWLGVTAMMLVACGGGGGMDDAGGGAMVAPPMLGDVDEMLGDVGEPCVGVAAGTTSCSSGRGRSCCGGHWQEFYDGPCAPRYDTGTMNDSGGADAGSVCDADETAAGCPCATEGEIACRFIQFRHVCREGAWAVDDGFVCC